MDVYMYLMSNG